ncbi:MAG: chemotaxis protein CheW [Phycisphaerales bacterium]|nr:chemotaxis protein CheW [Phycisphaerales bacterium]
MLSDQNELIESFVTEAAEGLDGIETDLLAMEADGANIDVERVNKIFRSIHSIKGTAGFLGLTAIGALSHEMENVLNMIRNRELTPGEAVVEALIRGSDLLRNMVSDVNGSNGVDVSKHVAALKSAVKGQASPAVAETPDHEIDVLMPSGGVAFMGVSEKALRRQQERNCHIHVVEADLINDVESKGLTPVQFLQRVYACAELMDSYISTSGVGTLDSKLPAELLFRMLLASEHGPDDLHLELGLPSDRVHPIATPDHGPWDSPRSTPSPGPAAEETARAKMAVAAPAPGVSVRPEEAADSARPSAAPVKADATLRVGVRILDNLMTLAGELVLARNQLLQISASKSQAGIDSVANRIDQVTSDLQEAIMQTRMQPVGTVLGKFQRVVRDLSKTLNKQCDLFIEGNEVELDKTIIEAIGDPLTHLVRNALDHGLETPDRREAKGKKPTGQVHIRAFHQGGKVNITIADDGAGIDPEKLKTKAVQKKIITSDQARSMSEREAIRLIFHPGFSMAEKVTEVSGRGVGMDVVRTNIEKLGGTVDVETQLGAGTTIAIRLPLTLAIIPALIVWCNEKKYALPQVHIHELIRVKASEVRSKIRRINDAEVLHLRGSLLPLVRLSKALGVPSRFRARHDGPLADNHRLALADRRDDGAPLAADNRRDGASDRREDTHEGALNIIVAEAGALRYGLVVDGLDDSQEIVVKPLGRHMKQCICLAGATVLGDGRVAMILDVTGISQHCGLKAPDDTQTDAADAAKDAQDLCTVLMFRNHETEHFAVPTALISRIENIKAEQIDSVGGREILQYRGRSLPLLRLEHYVKAKPGEVHGGCHVAVFNVADHEVGLVIPRLGDIRDISTHLDTAAFCEPGVFGSLIVQDATTRVVDLIAVTRRAYAEWFEAAGGAASGPAGIRIVLAEDSAFFRGQVVSFLHSAGFEVEAFNDGEGAWARLQKSGPPVDLVLTDIEMPRVTGLELTRRIKADPRLRTIPVFALTSLVGAANLQQGREAGVDEYLVKLDRELLISAIQKRLGGAGGPYAANGSASALVGRPS